MSGPDKPKGDDTQVYLPFSQVHYESARHLADLAKSLEDGDGSSQNEIYTYTSGQIPIHSRHRAYVVSSIVSSVSFIEAAINEIIGAILHPEYSFPGYNRAINESKLNVNVIKRMNSELDISMSDWRYILKYQSLLVYSGAKTFKTGTEPLQSVKIVRKIRNYLIHYKPEMVKWNEFGKQTHIEHKIGSAVQDKFELNPLVDETAVFFPIRCLSSGCANWCIDTNVEFLKKFYSRLDISHPHPAHEIVFDT